MVQTLMAGAMVLAAIAIGVSFLRSWRKTGDRFFLMFAVAFWLLGANRLGLSLTSEPVEARTLVYGVRLLAFLLILAAIVDKNLVPSGRK